MANAKVTPVRYTQPQIPAWRQALGGFAQGAMSGMAGYYGRQRQQQENIMKLLPVFAQMKMLKPGGTPGQPGVVGVPGAGNFSIGQPAETTSDELNRARTEWYRSRDPWAENLVKAYSQAVSISGRPDDSNNYTPDPDVINYIMKNKALPPEEEKEDNTVKRKLPANWDEAGAVSRFFGRMTPWQTPTESRLGTIKWGGKKTKDVNALKIKRAKEINALNPNLSKEEIISMVNEEFGE